MNAMEKMAVQPTNEVVSKMLKDRNKGTEDCVTTSEVAREWGMTAPDLNRSLIDMNIMKRSGADLQLTLKYQSLGYAKTRSVFRYSRMGQLKEIVYPVWTPKGVDFLRRLLKVNN